MSEQQTAAASSPAEVVDVFQGQQPSMAEYTKYRQAGELPERFKSAEKADSAPADAPEKTVVESEGDEPESESDSEPDEAQEPPQKGSGAEKRIKQLLAKQKELERKLAEVAKPDAKSDSSPAQANQQPLSYKDWRASFNPGNWVSQFATNNPTASYEDATAAMAEYLSDAKDHFRTIEQRAQAERQTLEAKVSEAKDRYEDFDDVKSSFLGEVLSDKGVPLIPVQVLSIINDSDVVADLIHTLGSDEAEMRKFVALAKSDPNKAIRYVAKVESLIAEELATPRDDSGKFAKSGDKQAAPEPKKTSAPKPPSPVGGGSSKAFDVSDDSLSAEEWFRQRNAQVARRKG